jgi:hypothetical protein
MIHYLISFLLVWSGLVPDGLLVSYILRHAEEWARETRLIIVVFGGGDPGLTPKEESVAWGAWGLSVSAAAESWALAGRTSAMKIRPALSVMPVSLAFRDG